MAATPAAGEETVVAVAAATRFRRVALALFCCVGAALAAEQDPQKPVPAPVQDPQRPVFRAGVDVVRVDVYPRRRNKIVEGLTAADFQLTEDGVSQTIETFEYIPIEMGRGIEPLDPRNAAEAQRMAADPRNRVFVFYLDTYRDHHGGRVPRARTAAPFSAGQHGTARPVCLDDAEAFAGVSRVHAYDPGSGQRAYASGRRGGRRTRPLPIPRK